MGIFLCDTMRRYDDAVVAMRHAVVLNPKNAGAQGNIGVALRNKRDYVGALEALEKSLANATSNENWQANPKLLQEIADASFS